MRERLKESKRIVIKVGTSTLTYNTGSINLMLMDKLARVISDLVNQGKEVVLVSSGAIGVGAGILSLDAIPQSVREKQAVAAVGQGQLMHIYSKMFSEYNKVVAQILLTSDVLANTTGKQNVINTFETLLEKGIIPIVNENDSVSTDEIIAGEHDTFSENDKLSALVGKFINADLLIIMSDIDGLYDCDPRVNSCPKLISIVEAITPEIYECAGGSGTLVGTGGMKTKLEAAKIAAGSGVDVVITNGNNPMSIIDIINGSEIGTFFVSKKQ